MEPILNSNNKTLKLLSGHLEESDIARINQALDDAYKAGVEKVLKWVDDNCIGVDTPTNDPDDYIGIQSMEWQAFKEELRQELPKE